MTYTIRNRVPSADEMGKSLGLSKKRVAAVRFIMSSPSNSKRAATSRAKKSAKRISTRKSGR
jgi:hypothetical protein